MLNSMYYKNFQLPNIRGNYFNQVVVMSDLVQPWTQLWQRHIWSQEKKSEHDKFANKILSSVEITHPKT